jgi:hypothetical protein
MMKLAVGQLREALEAPTPVLRVESHQDKIRMAHYVPLHPQVIEAIRPLLERHRRTKTRSHRPRARSNCHCKEIYRIITSRAFF